MRTLRRTGITFSLLALVLGLIAALAGAPAQAQAPASGSPDTGSARIAGMVFAPAVDHSVPVPPRRPAASRPSRGTPAARPTMVRGEPLASRNMRVTFSTRGVAASAYIGPAYDRRFEAVRRCIVKRESEGVYTVRGGDGGNYFGAYQMSDALADGAAWMMVPTLKKEIGKPAAKAVAARLRARPFNTWSRYWQDRAFWTIWNHGKGASHWAGGRWRC